MKRTLFSTVTFLVSTLCFSQAVGTGHWTDTNNTEWRYTIENEGGDLCAHIYEVAGNVPFDLVIPNMVGDDEYYSVTVIGEKALADNSNLINATSLTISSGIREIGKEAFIGCKNINTVSIPSTVTLIGSGAFSDSSSLSKAEFGSIASLCNIYFASATANPLRNAMHLYIDGKEVKDLVIPEGVKRIGDYTFYNCSSLRSVSLPGSVTSIGNYAFFNCTDMGNPTIPESVTVIGNYAFGRCHFSTVNIGNNVKEIGNYAFYNTYLTSVDIPNSVVSIGASAFELCDRLTSVTVHRAEPLYIGQYTFSTRTNATLFVPFGCTSRYESADYWKDFKEIKETTERVLGDINGDGRVDITDVTSLVNIILDKK